jgi:hypothetical protein
LKPAWITVGDGKHGLAKHPTADLKAQNDAEGAENGRLFWLMNCGFPSSASSRWNQLGL